MRRTRSVAANTLIVVLLGLVFSGPAQTAHAIWPWSKSSGKGGSSDAAPDTDRETEVESLTRRLAEKEKQLAEVTKERDSLRRQISPTTVVSWIVPVLAFAIGAVAPRSRTALAQLSQMLKRRSAARRPLSPSLAPEGDPNKCPRCGTIRPDSQGKCPKCALRF